MSKQTASIISTYASDASGVASALYELGGMTIIHDASGCNSTYNTHDEPRWYDMDSMVYISAVSEMEAIMGDDSRWVDELIHTANELEPRFIAICGSPIPMMIGTDFEALAMEVESATGIPTFGIPTNGMHSYIWGASKAFACLAERLVPDRPKTAESSANILGLTPLDFSINGQAESIRRAVEAGGYHVISSWAMGDTLDTLLEAASAHINFVVSESGLAAAKVLEERFGTPYIAGVPMDGKLLQTQFPPSATLHADIVIIGESMQSLSLAEAIRARTGRSVQVLCATEPEEELASLVVSARDEEEILPFLTDARIIIADPLYRPICPETAKFVIVPHEGFSGRIYRSQIPDLTGGFDKFISQEVFA